VHLIVGIDPGMQGAISVLTPEGRLEGLWDTPTLMLKTSRGTRQEYDVVGMTGILAPYVGPQTHVLIEESQSLPGQGVRSTWTTGYGFGIWLGILGALGLAHTRVRPAVWKRRLGLTSDKEQCRLRAMQLYPAADLRLRKHHGRAEALLMAWYGSQVGIGVQIQRDVSLQQKGSA
jgi:hypothetical protein